MCHVFCHDPLVELLGGYEAQRDGCFFEAGSIFVGFLGDLRGFVVADVWVQSGDEHEGVFYIAFDDRQVRLDADGAVVVEGMASLSKEADGVQEIVDDDGLEDIQLEVALRGSDADGGVVAHDLDSNHGEGFGLGGVHLAGHDRRAGLVFGDYEFAEAAAGAGGKPADVVGDLHERAGEGFYSSAGDDEFIVAGEGGKFVGRGLEWEAGEFCDVRGGTVTEFGVGIQARADGGAADGELVKAGEREFNVAQGLVEQAHIAGEFLPECERSGILEVRATDLDDVGKDGGLGVERIAEFFHGRDEDLDNLAG